MTGDLYTWLKALHVISVIAWMAGMLYLPRLYVYHCAAKPGSEQSETFKVMERRLLRAIINPAMGAAWIFGLTMAWLPTAHPCPNAASPTPHPPTAPCAAAWPSAKRARWTLAAPAACSVAHSASRPSCTLPSAVQWRSRAWAKSWLINWWMAK